jgi:GalNAc-alpha-(1->4)-GalNAc-alpha-(1->3)-diNAcBac-PP-undecaprenol alpha-1,4-N-acetyl-D-galactosaminyltransferase
MKILLVTKDLSDGGAERRFANIANILTNEGHDVHIVSYFRVENEYKLNDNIKVTYLGKNKSNLNNLRFGFKLKRYVDKISPDYIFSILSTFRYFPRKRSWKHIHFISNTRNQKYKNFASTILNTHFENKCVKNADLVIAQCNEQVHEYPVEIQKKMFVIENPIPNIFFANQKTTLNSINRFVAVGRLNTQKNHYFMIESFAQIAIKYGKTLDIYGSGELKEELKLLIQRLGVSEYIKLKGNTKNIHEILKEYDAYLLTSRFEGLSNSLLEAMSVGLVPIVVKCKTGIVDIIENEITGMMVDKFDIAEYVTAIEKIIQNLELANNISSNAKLRCFNTNRDEVFRENIIKILR